MIRHDRLAAAVLVWSVLTAGSAAFGRLPGARPAAGQTGAGSLEDLPLVEVPAKGPARDVLAVLLTGDGGWAAADRGLANDLATAGIPVVGYNTLKYFWAKRTPERAAADLERVLRHYLPAWHKSRAVLVGYSLGADVLPFMLNRLPDDLQAVVAQAVLIGPSETVEFEFHVLDWLGRSSGKGLLVIPEIQKIRPEIAILCVYGEKDTDQICGRLDRDRVQSVALAGGHKMGSGFGPVAEAILSTLKTP